MTTNASWWMALAASAVFAVSLMVLMPLEARALPKEEPTIPAVATTTPQNVSATTTVAKKTKPEIVEPTSAPGDCEKYRSLIEEYDWPVATAMRICEAESHGYAGAINWHDKHYDAHGNLVCVSSRGLFQVACFWPWTYGLKTSDLLDPNTNVFIAHEIWKESGFLPWSTYTPGT